MSATFTHLHVHTQFSLLDSSLRLDPLFAKACSDGMEALAITDHGNMFGVIDFYNKAKECGIKPILGSELYLVPGSRLQKQTHGTPDNDLAPYSPSRSGLFHLVLLCMNEIGYLNLCRLVSAGYLEGFYYKPRIDKEILSRHSEGLIATSACLKGEVAHLCVQGLMDQARETALTYKNIFRGRFYLEIQQNGVPQQALVNQRFMELSKELDIPLIATADCHYLNREDAYYQEILMAIQTGRILESTGPEIVKTDEFYFKPQKVMEQEFGFCPEAISNTMEIARQCNFEFRFTDEKGKKIYHSPKFEPPNGKTQGEYLKTSAQAGLNKRLGEIENRRRNPFTEDEKLCYSQRLEKELAVIIEMGFTGYFLIVADFIQAARDRNIPVGPGRGSGAGSLVAYSLGITNLDPIEHGLLFERFLNPERISLPDFDIDFCMEKRDRVIEYVAQKYGKENVAQIITFGKLQARGVMRDSARVFGITPPEIDPVAKLVPKTLNITLKDAFEQEPRLRTLEEKDSKMHLLFEVCRALEGLYRHASIHAAGLVISNRPMVEHCPLYRGKNDELVIQFDMNNADHIGLIKFDFLGLTTLTFLQEAEKLIQRHHPEDDFSVDKINLSDRAIYRMLSTGDSLGVFQLESQGMQELMKKLQPDCFDDIVASNALYRPGPMGSGMLDDFVNRKLGLVPVTYDFAILEPILEETYGIIVYQEQVQQIAMKLANYTAGAADILRRAMGKKKEKEMTQQKKIFLDGAQKNGYDLGKAEKIFDLMAKFAGYGFNKSHAAAYSFITCQTAYIKARYPVEFYAALLTIERENTDKITKYIADAKAHQIETLQPDINESDTDFTVQKGNRIRFGLGAIKGVGQVAIDSILESRNSHGKFCDLYEVASQTNNRTVNKRVMEALVKAGAFDSFFNNRASLFAAVDEALTLGSSIQKQNDDNQSSFAELFGGEDPLLNKRKVEYPDVPRWNRLQELNYEKDTIGIFVTGHPLDDFEEELKRYTTSTIEGLLGLSQPRDVLIGAQLISLRQIFTKKGDRMAFAGLQDKTGNIEAVIFSDTFLGSEPILKGNEPLWIRGRLEAGENGNKLVLSRKSGSQVLPLRYAFEALARELHIHIALSGNQTKFDKTKIEQLRTVTCPPGKQVGGPLFLHLKVGKGATTVLKLRQTVPLTRETVSFIKEVFKEERVNLEFR